MLKIKNIKTGEIIFSIEKWGPSNGAAVTINENDLLSLNFYEKASSELKVFVGDFELKSSDTAGDQATRHSKPVCV